MKILWLKYCTYMCQPQTYKIAKCLSEFSKTGLNKRIPREGTRTIILFASVTASLLNKRIPREGTRTLEPHCYYLELNKLNKRIPREGTRTLYHQFVP